MTTMFNTKEFSGAERETLWQLFRNGPTWDGNLASKSGRDALHEMGFVDRFDGWNWLKSEGVILAIEIGLGKDTEKGKCK